MSTNQDRGEPGLQYPEDLHQDSIPVQKAFRMTVDNLNFLKRRISEISALLGTSNETVQQLINQTIIKITGGGGGGPVPPSGAIIYASTHAVRIITYGTASDPVGTLFIETDRTSIYYISGAYGINRWVFAAGMMVAAIALRPADLGVYDAGFSFVASDTTELTQYLWTGTLWITVGGLRQIISDAVTNASVNVFRMAHRSSGIPVANFGAIARTELDNSTHALVDASALDTFWTTATTTAETSAWAVQLRNAGAALADFFQVLINGIRFKVGSFFGKFTHANSADRTYTLPDADGNITYETAVLTSGNFLEGGGGAKVSDTGFSDVPYSRFIQATAASKLVGRGSASGAGDMEEISLGSGLVMTGTTLSASGGGGGDFTKIAQVTIASDGNPVSFTSISGSFLNLKLICYSRSTLTADLRLRFNADSGGNYDWEVNFTNGATAVLTGAVADSSIRVQAIPGNASSSANQMASSEITIPVYSGTTFWKQGYINGGATVGATTANNPYVEMSSFNWRNTGAITRIDLLPSAGGFKAGSVFVLYGLS